MAVAKYFRFTKATGTGTQTVTGIGVDVKGVILWTSWQTAVGESSDVQTTAGVGDRDLNQACRFTTLTNGVTATGGLSTPSAQSERTNAILYKTSAVAGISNTAISATPTVEVEAALSSAGAGFIQLNFTTNNGLAEIIHGIAFGGTDVEAQLVPAKLTQAAGVSLDITGAGFDPTAYVVLGGAVDEFGTGDYNVSAPFGSMHGFGFHNTAGSNYCVYALNSPQVNSAPDTCRGYHLSRVVHINVANNGTSSASTTARITANLTDGYRIRKDAGGTGSQPVQHVLCLRGVRFGLTSITVPTSATRTPIRMSFWPEAMMFESVNSAAGDGAHSTDGMEMMIGGWSSSSQGAAWVGAPTASNPSVARRGHNQTGAITIYNRTSGGIASQAVVDLGSQEDLADGIAAWATFSSVAAGGAVVIVMGVAAAPSQIGSFAFGDAMLVRANRSMGMGLDGANNVLLRDGTFKIYGDLEVTGYTKFGNNSKARQLNFVITDTLTKTLPTTFQELVPTPGPNYGLIFHWAAIYIDAPTPYTNIDTGLLRGLFISYGDWIQDCSTFTSFWDGSAQGYLLQPQDLPINDSRYGGFFYPVSAIPIALDLPLKLGAWNNSGNYTGGNSGNRLRGTISYSIFYAPQGTIL